MGVKSNYFRHSFEAHNDPKLRKLIAECGAKGYAVYFVLLEIYCAKLRDDDRQEIEQEIDLKVLASYLGVRSDFVHRCIIVSSKLNLLSIYGETTDILQKTMIKLSIPNSLKYYGKYKKVSDEKSPNKRKEKEIKIKESKIGNNSQSSDCPSVVLEIIEYMNKKLGSSYKKSRSTINPIKARISEGFVFDDFKSVILHKVDDWGSDPKMKQYLRPSTLFGGKFESYLEASRQFEKDYEEKRQKLFRETMGIE